MRQRTIYFDLDGTLTDVYDRYLGVLNDFLSLNDIPRVRKNEYISGKKRGLKEHEIVCRLTNCQMDIDSYVKYKRSELEKPDRLRMDILLCSPDILRKTALELGCRICLLTLRRDARACREQLHWLGMDEVFHEIYIAKINSEINPKAEMIKDHVTNRDIVIGDSRLDMECAEMFGLKGYYVRTGLGADPGRTEFNYHEEKLFDNVCEVLRFLKNQMTERRLFDHGIS